MIFVPSIAGISHNPAENTRAEHLELGANVLLHTLLSLADQEINQGETRTSARPLPPRPWGGTAWHSRPGPPSPP